MLDLSTKYGRNVAWRLESERIIWLTTVSREYEPRVRPVWFLWTGDAFLIYSKPNTLKLRHISDNPLVGLNFDGDGLGGNIMAFGGVARVAEVHPPANQVGDYVEKYRRGIARLQCSEREFALEYSVPIIVSSVTLYGQ